MVKKENASKKKGHRRKIRTQTMPHVGDVKYKHDVQPTSYPNENGSLPVSNEDIPVTNLGLNQDGRGDQECPAHPGIQQSFGERLKNTITRPFRRNGRFSPVQLPRIKKHRLGITLTDKKYRHDELNEEMSPRANSFVDRPGTVRHIAEEDIESLDFKNLDIDENMMVSRSGSSIMKRFENFGRQTRMSLASLGRSVSSPFISCFRFKVEGNRRLPSYNERLEMDIANVNYVTNESTDKHEAAE